MPPTFAMSSAPNKGLRRALGESFEKNYEGRQTEHTTSRVNPTIGEAGLPDPPFSAGENRR